MKDEKTCSTREIIYPEEKTLVAQTHEGHEELRVKGCRKPDTSLLVKLRLESLRPLDFPMVDVRGE